MKARDRKVARDLYTGGVFINGVTASDKPDVSGPEIAAQTELAKAGMPSVTPLSTVGGYAAAQKGCALCDAAFLIAAARN